MVQTKGRIFMWFSAEYTRLCCRGSQVWNTGFYCFPQYHSLDVYACSKIHTEMTPERNKLDQRIPLHVNPSISHVPAVNPKLCHYEIFWFYYLSWLCNKTWLQRDFQNTVTLSLLGLVLTQYTMKLLIPPLENLFGKITVKDSIKAFLKSSH